MKKLAESSPEERLAMGEAGRQKVQDKFSETVVIRAYLDALDTLAGHRS
jgi:hypothetical protein